MRSDFTEEFQNLWDLRNPQKRGLLFENLFCRLLFKSGFVVHKNPRSALPRQTDLLAEYQDSTFLFELKWPNRKVDIDAVAQITNRLARTPKGTIGCLCSAAGFTETIIHDVEQHRSEFEVLLFNPHEIYSIFCRGESISRLIDEKRRALRRHGEMWFFDQDTQNAVNRYAELPPSYESIQASSLSIHVELDSQHHSDLLFARTPLIFNEYRDAVSLEIRLNDLSVERLGEVFVAAENHLGFQGSGTFGIRQTGSGWYGIGSENFLKEIARYSQRYDKYKGHIHHSEELVFFDELNLGIFLLSARQSLTRKGRIHSGEIVIRLPGIPADTQPYVRFIRSLTQENPFFRTEEVLSREHEFLGSTIKIKPSDVVTLIESNAFRPDIAISGIIIRNPFFRNSEIFAKLAKQKNLAAFAEPEYLICTLDDWLDPGDEVDYYVLRSVEMSEIGEAILLHPRCTWGDLTKRTDPTKGKGFQQLKTEWRRRDRIAEAVQKASERRKN